MKRLILPFALFLAAGPAFADPAPKGQDVTISVSGVEVLRGGHVVASLQTEAQFLKSAGKYSMKEDPKTDAKSGQMTFVFHDVAPGDYSFTVLHDQNDDGQMQMSSGGMPAEGWAMHNGQLLLGAPTFDDVGFTVGDKPLLFAEPMTYFAP